MSTQTQKWYQSPNFYTALILAFGGLFVGFPEGEGRVLVGSVFGTISAAMLIRQRLKTSTVDWRAWLTSKNTWNYLAAAVTAILPIIPVDLFNRLRDLADAALGGNWQGIITALFSIGTMIYYLVTGGGKPKA